MEFDAGDNVVHASYGVGNIVRVEEKRLAEADLRLYYVLAVENSTVWVPVNATGTIGLRRVTPKQELEKYRRVLKGKPTVLDRDHHKRRAEINERLKRGSFLSVCETTRDLTAHGWRRPLNDVDASMLQKVHDNLCREWAASAGVTMADATREVDELLQAGQASYKT
jgi:RNA polymerase-interacting CarD/CdnL/TRCF family regulator